MDSSGSHIQSIMHFNTLTFVPSIPPTFSLIFRRKLTISFLCVGLIKIDLLFISMLNSFLWFHMLIVFGNVGPILLKKALKALFTNKTLTKGLSNAT